MAYKLLTWKSHKILFCRSLIRTATRQFKLQFVKINQNNRTPLMKRNCVVVLKKTEAKPHSKRRLSSLYAWRLGPVKNDCPNYRRDLLLFDCNFRLFCGEDYRTERATDSRTDPEECNLAQTNYSLM